MPEDFDKLSLEADLESQADIEDAITKQTLVKVKEDGVEVEKKVNELGDTPVTLSDDDEFSSTAIELSSGNDARQKLSGTAKETNGEFAELDDGIEEAQKLKEEQQERYNQKTRELQQAYKETTPFEKIGLGIFAFGSNALDEFAFGVPEIVTQVTGSPETRAEIDFFDKTYSGSSKLGWLVGVGLPALLTLGGSLATKFGAKSLGKALASASKKTALIDPQVRAFGALSKVASKGVKVTTKSNVAKAILPKALRGKLANNLLTGATVGSVSGALYGSLNGLPPSEGAKVGTLGNMSNMASHALSGAGYGFALGGSLNGVIGSALWLSKTTNNAYNLGKKTIVKLGGGSRKDVVKGASSIFLNEEQRVLNNINQVDDIVAVKALSVFGDNGKLTLKSQKQITNYVKKTYKHRPVDGLLPDTLLNNVEAEDVSKALVSLQNKKRDAYVKFNAKQTESGGIFTRTTKEVTPTTANISDDLRNQNAINIMADTDALRKTNIVVDESVAIVEKPKLIEGLNKQIKNIFIAGTEEVGVALNKLETLKKTYNGIGTTADNTIKTLQKELKDFQTKQSILTLESKEASNKLYKLKVNEDLIQKYKLNKIQYKNKSNTIKRSISTEASTVTSNTNKIQKITNKHKKDVLDGVATESAKRRADIAVNKLKTENQKINKANITRKTNLAELNKRQDKITQAYNKSKLKVNYDKSVSIKQAQIKLKDDILRTEKSAFNRKRKIGFIKDKDYDGLVRAYPDSGEFVKQLKEIDNIEKLVKAHKTSDAFNFYKQFKGEVKEAKSIQQLEALANRVDDIAGAYAKAGQPTGQTSVQALAKQAKRLLNDQIDEQLVKQYKLTGNKNLLEKILLRRMRAGNIDSQDTLLRALGLDDSTIRDVRAIQTSGLPSSTLIALPAIGLLKSAQIKASTRKVKALRKMYSSDKEYNKMLKQAGFDINNPTPESYNKAFGLSLANKLNKEKGRIYKAKAIKTHAEEQISKKNLFFRETLKINIKESVIKFEEYEADAYEFESNEEEIDIDELTNDTSSIKETLKDVDVSYLQGLSQFELSEEDTNKFVESFDSSVGSYYKELGNGFSDSTVGSWGHIVNKYAKNLGSEDRHQMINMLNKPYRTLDVILHQRSIPLTEGAIIALREAYPSIAGMLHNKLPEMLESFTLDKYNKINKLLS